MGLRETLEAATPEVVTEFRTALDVGFCGNRSSDLPLDHEFPPAVCILPAGHDGMHRDGHCAWGPARLDQLGKGPGDE